MIKYDYVIERKISKSKMRKFIPEAIPTKLPNLVYIEGPNSLGKSTLLNIIALGFFGTRNKRIHPALLYRMNSLLDSDYQKVKFHVQIESENDNLVLCSEKADLKRTEIVVKERTADQKWSPISPEKFESKYNLIYDIPSNPLERLYDLLKELKEEQGQYGNRFKEFGFFLRSVINQVTAGRDTNRLMDIKKKLAKYEQDREKIADELPGKRKFLDSLEKNAYVKFYYYYLNECATIRQTQEEILKKSKRLGKGGKELTKELAKHKDAIATLQGDFSRNYTEVTSLIADSLPKEEKSRFKIWKEINPYSTESNELDTVSIEAVHYIELFESELQKIQSESSFRDADTLERVIQSLKEFEDSTLMIPGIEVTIGELIRILREENKKNYLLISKYKKIANIVDLLKELMTTTDNLRQQLEELRKTSAVSRKLSEEYGASFYEQKRQLENLEATLEEVTKKCDYYLQRCLSKGIDRKQLEGGLILVLPQLPRSEEIETFLSLSEKQIEEKIAASGKEIIRDLEQLKTLDELIKHFEKERKDLEKQRPHKYEKYQEQLNELLKKTDAISQKLLSEYNNNIKSLMDRKAKTEEIEADEGKKRYYEEVSKYLAHRIGLFRHIGTTYKAKVVDLISGFIITDNDETIHFATMGTGESQSAYILGLLNVKNDTRKIIALFDEIAMMDDNSLKPVFDKLLELHRAKKLLLGILVQRGNEVKIRPLVQ